MYMHPFVIYIRTHADTQNASILFMLISFHECIYSMSLITHTHMVLAQPSPNSTKPDKSMNFSSQILIHHTRDLSLNANFEGSMNPRGKVVDLG
jgi:hypothetical protein